MDENLKKMVPLSKENQSRKLKKWMKIQQNEQIMGGCIMDENTRCFSQFLETFKEIAWFDESMWKWRHTKPLHAVTNIGKLGHISLRTAISYPTSPLSIGCPLIPMFNCLRFSFANFIHCLMISYPLLSFASLTSSFVVDDSFFCFSSSLLLLIVIS